MGAPKCLALYMHAMVVPAYWMAERSVVMDSRHLMGRYLRLQKELSRAYCVLPWESSRIDRLANEIAATEWEIAESQAGDPGRDQVQRGPGTGNASRRAGSAARRSIA